MKNYFNYFTEVEDYFIRLRGKSLLVSPLDWCLIELWRDGGIPLHVVLRGIDRSFEAAEGARRRAPSTLAYCHPAVLEAFEEYRSSQVGAGEEEGTVESEELISRDRVVAYLEELKSSLESLGGGELEGPVKRVKALREEAAGEKGAGESAGPLDLRRLDQDLSRVAETVADHLWDRLSDGDREELNGELKAEIRIYRKRLSREVADRLESTFRRRRVLERFGLPEFSLLGLDGQA